jgi:hypothetical protein
MKKLSLTCYALIILFSCCKKPYAPPATSTPNSYLVVEGVINSGNDSTFIKLSKTVKLTNRTTTNPLLGATVTVESDQNSSFPLIDAKGTGTYSSGPLNLPASQKYRLHIITGSGSDYLSDFVAVKTTPPIDTIGFPIDVKDSTVNIYVNAHNPANSTRYYRWDYIETWEFHSKYYSSYVLNAAGTAIVHRTASQQVYECYTTVPSSTIVLTSTAKLANDVVYQMPVIQIPFNSEKFEYKYSILLKQYALTSEAYQFYVNMKTNTEQLGSIFDAQPTELMGNIHNTKNVNEPVIGYITVTNPQSKRIFITTDELPPYLVAKYPYDCEQDTAKGPDVQNTLINPPLTDIPTTPLLGGGYLYSTPICVDCTLRGTKTTPSFWQ